MIALQQITLRGGDPNSELGRRVPFFADLPPAAREVDRELGQFVHGVEVDIENGVLSVCRLRTRRDERAAGVETKGEVVDQHLGVLLERFRTG